MGQLAFPLSLVEAALIVQVVNRIVLNHCLHAIEIWVLWKVLYSALMRSAGHGKQLGADLVERGLFSLEGDWFFGGE